MIWKLPTDIQRTDGDLDFMSLLLFNGALRIDSSSDSESILRTLDSPPCICFEEWHWISFSLTLLDLGLSSSIAANRRIFFCFSGGATKWFCCTWSFYLWFALFPWLCPGWLFVRGKYTKPTLWLIVWWNVNFLWWDFLLWHCDMAIHGNTYNANTNAIE